MKRVLAGGLGRIGDFGLVAPLLAVAMGWLFPPLAQLGYAILVPSMILMFTMTVAMAEPGRLHWHEAWPVVGLALCNLLLSPLLAAGLVLALELNEVGGWVVLVAASPAAGAATLAAGLLGLPMRPMLLAQLLCFFALPLTAPLVATMMLDAAVVDPWGLSQRVAVAVALPSLLGLALRRALRGAKVGRSLRGLGTLGLCGVGLALAHGLSVKLEMEIPWAVCGLAVALVMVMGGALGFATGVLSGRLGGARLGAAFALGGAVRNVSLLWSATIGLSTPEGEAVMMLGTLWTFVLPALLALLMWRRTRSERVSGPFVPDAHQGGRAGMIVEQFSANFRVRDPRPRSAVPNVPVLPGGHGPRGLAHSEAAPRDDLPLIIPRGSLSETGLEAAGQQSVSVCNMPRGLRAAQAFGRGAP